MDKEINNKIKKLRKELNISIAKTGLESEETRKISTEMDKLINKYYGTVKIKEYPRESIMIQNYNDSYEALKKVTLEFGKFPSIEEWTHYAKENVLLNATSMQYISKLDWNGLRHRALVELNLKIL